MKITYTQKNIVQELLKLNEINIEFGNTVNIVADGADSEKIKLVVSKINLIINIDKETYILPFESITDFYTMSYSSSEIIINTKNINLRIKLKHIEKEEE